ncbi:hypothetical protein [Lacibacter sp.]|uniref:hypothetical protein n=1 Tax=Lacibacter sp. TaxID=1915409 RepID=UPI002B4B74F6|nr:hypothetical protein [Lacibacter sp.]HLP39358.1 hypothetical protein [Lacibacter sp.]
MKQKLLLSLLAIIILLACKKENANEQPTDLRASGFLCTIGIKSNEQAYPNPDTICVGSNSSGTSYSIRDYSHTAIGSFVVRPRDIWTLETTGDNNWYLKNHMGKYLSFEDTPYPVNDEYSIDFDDAPTEKSVFLRSHNNGQNFYLESKFKRGYFLISRAANVSPPDPSHSAIRFQKKQQLWFFMP